MNTLRKYSARYTYSLGSNPKRDGLSLRKSLRQVQLSMLQILGILDENVIAAHCKVVEEGDLEILSASSCFPIFCPTTHGLSGKPMDTNFLTKNEDRMGDWYRLLWR